LAGGWLDEFQTTLAHNFVSIAKSVHIPHGKNGPTLKAERTRIPHVP
jgi:hypothetical protein